jgi:aconitate hydratase
VAPGSEVTVTATDDRGAKKPFTVRARIDTEIENEYFKHGGLLPYVLRLMMAKQQP